MSDITLHIMKNNVTVDARVFIIYKSSAFKTCMKFMI